MHVIQIVHDLFQHGKPSPPVVHSPCSMVMNQPGPLVSPHHGDMTIDHPVRLVGEMLLNLGALLVDLLIGLFETLPMRLDKAILRGIDKPCLKEEFPQGVHVDLAGNTGMGVQGTGEDVCQTAVRIDIHIQNGKAATDAFSFFLRAVDHLGRTLHPHSTGKIDYQLGDDHPLQKNSLI
ncbi:hypothetical protein ES703_70236 [subsurface metagenome]